MGKTLSMEGTRLLERTLQTSARVLVHQGGTRSSKSYSLAQACVIWLVSEPGIIITVTRKTMPALKRGAMRDVMEVLKGNGLYNPAYHNKTDHVYAWPLMDSMIEFVAADDPQKMRGPGRDIAWLNEANEFTKEDWRQINMRTRRLAMMDYNPSMVGKHWIYDDVLPREDAELVVSTYLDNPFLPSEQVQEIERLKHTDPEAWNVYGLGKRGVSEATIYPRWHYADSFPPTEKTARKEHWFGLDFGYNNPSALVRITTMDAPDEKMRLYWHQELYESHLTNQDLIERIAPIVGTAHDPKTPRPMTVYCDAAEPGRIEALVRAGIDAVPADKSVSDGILTVKRHSLYITKESVDLADEAHAYRYKTDRDGDVTEDVLKANDHGMDAGRYGSHTHLTQPQVDYGRL